MIGFHGRMLGSCLRKQSVPERYVRLVKDTYEDARTQVKTNDHWWLAENGKGQVGYVPAAYLMIILDETLQEEDSDTRKEGH